MTIGIAGTVGIQTRGPTKMFPHISSTPQALLGSGNREVLIRPDYAVLTPAIGIQALRRAPSG